MLLGPLFEDVLVIVVPPSRVMVEKDEPFAPLKILNVVLVVGTLAELLLGILKDLILVGLYDLAFGSLATLIFDGL